MTMTDRTRERLEVRSYTISGREVAVTGWRTPAVWNEREIAPEHIHLIASVGRSSPWHADMPHEEFITHRMPDPADYPHTELHLYRVDPRCPKYARRAFDLYLDDLT